MDQLEEIKYFEEIKERGNAYFIVAQMAALLKDTDNKAKEMENQKWYERMIKTVFGKNKATVEEIKCNKDKISSYMASIIAEMLRREIVSEQAIFGIENQVNEIVEDQNELKKRFIKFLNLFETEKHFNRINHQIQNDAYKSESKLLSLCMIMSDMCLDLFKSDSDLEIIKSGLIQKGYISDEEILFSDLLLEFANTDSSIQDMSKIYYVLSGISMNSNKMAIICELIERYSLLPSKEKQGISTKKVISKILDDYQFDDEAVVSTKLLYECFIDEGKESLDRRNTYYKMIEMSETISSDADKVEDEKLEFLVEEEFVDEEVKDTSEMSDEIISSIFQINPEEKKKYVNKNIHISSFINCKGTLEIDHCVLYYNESDASDEITLCDGSRLIIRDSCIICKGFDESFFISTIGLTKNVEIVFENTTFVDCSRFVFLDGQNNNIKIKGCKLNNCFEAFLVHLGQGKIDISENYISQERLSQFNIDNQQEKGGLIFAFKESAQISFYDNVIKEDEGFKDCFDEEKEWTYISCREADIKNCTFLGISFAINGNKISECKFDNCTNGISIFCYKESIVEDCVFEKCHDAIYAVTPVKISHCQFVSCYDFIILLPSFLGGNTIEFCDFYNIKNSDDFGNANIVFAREKGSKNDINIINKCIFNGAQLGESLLINVRDGKKANNWVGIISECDFRNCTTKMPNGIIIKDFVIYDTLLKKEQTDPAIKYIGCRGLDKVNQEGNECQNYEIKTTSTTGSEIGSKVAIVASGCAGFSAGLIATAIGGPLAGLGVSGGILICDQVIKHVNKKAKEKKANLVEAEESLLELKDENKTSSVNEIIKLSGNVVTLEDGEYAGETVVMFDEKLYRKKELLKMVQDIWTHDLGKKQNDFRYVELNVIIDGKKGFANYIINDEVKGSFVL